jgi:hypothetical protein
VSCVTITFATVNRASLARLKPEEMEAQLAKAPDPKRSEIKRQVVARGLDAPPAADALRQHEKLFDQMPVSLNGPKSPHFWCG